MLDSREVSIGLTSNFAANILSTLACVEGFEVFDSCLDATDYSPTGCMVDFKGSALIGAMFIR